MWDTVDLSCCLCDDGDQGPQPASLVTSTREAFKAAGTWTSPHRLCLTCSVLVTGHPACCWCSGRQAEAPDSTELGKGLRK